MKYTKAEREILKQHAVALRTVGFTIADSAIYCGVCAETLRQWTNPEAAQRYREWNRRRTQTPEYQQRDRELARRPARAAQILHARRKWRATPEGRAKEADRYNERKNNVETRFKDAIRFSQRQAAKTGCEPCKATWQEIAAAHVEQNGRCKICGVDESELVKRLSVDHCHATGEFRGLLCERCNKNLLGHCGDDPVILRRAADYLEGKFTE